MSSPSSASLALRASVAETISTLRRTTPRVPFWALAAHRVPTLWTLYRGLLRAAPGENTRWRIRGLFKRNHHLTSPIKTREALSTGHRWLDYLILAKEGDARKQKVAARFERIFGEMKRRSVWRDIYRRELEWIYRLRNRPILTGGFMRPTLFNRLTPRMYRQPIHLSMMIRARRLARARRLDEQRKWVEWRLDVLREAQFEKRLMSPANGIWQTEDWLQPIDDQLARIQASYRLDHRRALHFSPKHIVVQVLEARQRRIERKTAEAEKLARGEWVTRWKRVRVSKIKRAGVPKRLVPGQTVVVLKGSKGKDVGRRVKRVKILDPVHPHRDILHAPLFKRSPVNPRAGAPPPHILEGMSERAKWEDQVLRGRSGGGFVGKLRREKGWKESVKGGQGREDERSEEEDVKLKKLEDRVTRENARRRAMAERREKEIEVKAGTKR